MGIATSAPARAQSASPDYAMPRAGAPRVLRLIDASGKPLQGSFLQVKWETRGEGLFFTREWGGTRNVWRAFPDPQDSNRYPTWRALPVTQFQAPIFASDAAPIAGDSSLLMVSNATNPARPAQVVRFDLRTQSLRVLTDGALFGAGALDPAPSPDGSTMAFAATVGGVTSVYTQNFSSAAARRVVLNARHPAWQDGAMLLVESVANNGVFRLSLGDMRSVPLSKGVQVSSTRDGTLLALVATALGETGAETASRATSIYLLAGDGSGLRAVTGTQGARGPALSPGGRVLAFDAPLPGASSGRMLWVLPFERETTVLTEIETASRRVVVDNPQVVDNARLVQTQTRDDAPLSQITGVRRAPNGALAIFGVARGENATARLEIGSGTSPQRWTAFPIATGTPSGAPLLLWNPPTPRGVWTLRLSISNASGAAQSQFRLRLPLGVSIPSPVVTSSNPVLPSGGLLPRAPLPDLPAPPALPPLPPPALSSTSPVLTPAPPQTQTGRPGASTSAPLPAPAPFPPLGSPYTPLPPRRMPRPPLTQPLPSTPRATPQPPDSRAPRSASQGGFRDDATFNISGTLATMNAGQAMRVTFWAENKGNRGWDAAKSRQMTGAVRLVARWVDERSKTRRKWSMQWMKNAVAPGGRTSWSFDLVAPSQPGRYKLIYGLVRLPEDGWQAPAYNAPQESWPNEFSAIAFAVTVRP